MAPSRKTDQARRLMSHRRTLRFARAAVTRCQTCGQAEPTIATADDNRRMVERGGGCDTQRFNRAETLVPLAAR
jgi:hypothetical protein